MHSTTYHPLAPVHVVVVPKKHIATLNDIRRQGYLVRHAHRRPAGCQKKGVAESGYRIAVNCGRHGTQLVMHLHLHVLGGRQLEGKMG
ncbi:MAG: HIT domain-containing protein [Desulfobacterales bacterium]|nr:HIT domain-containing protein [Desulfobacterales bacterium]